MEGVERPGVEMEAMPTPPSAAVAPAVAMGAFLEPKGVPVGPHKTLWAQVGEEATGSPAGVAGAAVAPGVVMAATP